MEIGDVRIREVRNPEGKLRAVASITIDGCFVVHDIKIFEKDGAYFIAMPSRKISDGTFKDVAHPLNSETRELLQNAILEKYAEFRAQAKDE